MPYVNGTEGLTSSLATLQDPQQAREPKKLILCFDGTGNTFSGSNADTNVVKILNKLDRNAPFQHHYYQTGIGTYDINEHSVNQSWLGELRSKILRTIDEGIATTFDAHVLAAYRFLMRYYDSVSSSWKTTKELAIDANLQTYRGDKIYIFGFSRGAFTAKFLARMVYTVGLLCKGNEEMVPFAFRLYQKYLTGKIEDVMDAQPGHAEGAGKAPDEPAEEDEEDGHEHRRRMARDEIRAFSNTFCRNEQTSDGRQLGAKNIKVYFLGIWDCVNSVAVLERKTAIPVPVKGTAHFVRHAVAVDERRVKFKAALLAQDIRSSADDDAEDIKEVWFPGCHGDVGGGWPAVADHPLDSNERMTVWQRFRNFWTTRKPKEPSKDVGSDPFQMSDIPLAWMIREVELVGQKDPSAAVKWSNNVNGFKRRFQKKKDQALRGFMHDSLRFGHGSGFLTVSLWKLLEWFPLITRWELVRNQWMNKTFPPNMGAARDIPDDAVLHESLVWRLRNDASYHPTNNHGECSPPCLKHKGRAASVEPIFEAHGESDPDHQTYTFARSTTHSDNGV